MATHRSPGELIGRRRWRKDLPALACAAVMALAATAVRAQKQTPMFSSATTGVRVDVLVTDHNRPIAGLSAKDFELRDNGVLQTVTAVEASDAAISVVLVFDASGSTEGKRLTDLIDAGRALIAGLAPADRVGLITFSHIV